MDECDVKIDNFCKILRNKHIREYPEWFNRVIYDEGGMAKLEYFNGDISRHVYIDFKFSPETTWKDLLDVINTSFTYIHGISEIRRNILSHDSDSDEDADI